MHKRSKTKTTAALGVFANATLPFDKKLKRKTEVEITSVDMEANGLATCEENGGDW